MRADAEPAGDPILVVTGPTAAGKSELGLAIAEQLGAEIVSMDSMAVYRRMDIGTAKPTAEQRRRVPHYLIDVVDPDETFDTASFCRLADEALAGIRGRGRNALFVGGTPLYLMAFFKGLLEGPPADPELRRTLEAREREAPGSLHAELARRDPAAAARLHPHDHKRLVRALEVLERSGRTISEQQLSFATAGWRVPCRILIVDRPPDELRARIKLRTERMLAAGLVEETRSIRDSCGFSPTAAAAIGYAECLQHLRKPFKDDEELRNRIRTATHRLVRRQRNWLRRLGDARRLPAEGTADDALRLLA